MKHFLKTSMAVNDNQIRDKEVLNLIQEREEIEIGTRVVIYSNLITLDRDFSIEAIEIKGNKAIWQVI